MAQLIVRGIESEVVAHLKMQAAKNGHSAEEEHRQILRRALIREPETSLLELFLEMPDVGDDRDFERADELPRPVDL